MSFAATHVAPEGGLRAWEAPGAAEPLAATIDPGVPLQVTEWSGAWAHIVCDNGWTAWVDGRLLLAAPTAPAPAAPTAPPAPTPVPSPARGRSLPLDGLIGAALAVGAIFVPWVRAAGVDGLNAIDMPVGVLFDSVRGFDLALLVAVLAAALCLRDPRVRLAGVAGLTAVAALFAYQVDPKGLLGPGVLVVLAAAAAAAPFTYGTPGS